MLESKRNFKKNFKHKLSVFEKRHDKSHTRHTFAQYHLKWLYIFNPKVIWRIIESLWTHCVHFAESSSIYFTVQRICRLKREGVTRRRTRRLKLTLFIIDACTYLLIIGNTTMVTTHVVYKILIFKFYYYYCNKLNVGKHFFPFYVLYVGRT